jgi:ferredoxin
MRLRVDQSRCIGSGQCVVIQPGVFDQDDDEGWVVLMVERPEGPQVSGVRLAARSCPVQAIALVEE